MEYKGKKKNVFPFRQIFIFQVHLVPTSPSVIPCQLHGESISKRKIIITCRESFDTKYERAFPGSAAVVFVSKSKAAAVSLSKNRKLSVVCRVASLLLLFHFFVVFFFFLARAVGVKC